MYKVNNYVRENNVKVYIICLFCDESVKLIGIIVIFGKKLNYFVVYIRNMNVIYYSNGDYYLDKFLDWNGFCNLKFICGWLIL